MKKPEEIKKNLEDLFVCRHNLSFEQYLAGMHSIPDALALIQQLESKLKQAVADFHLLGRTGEFICPVCAHYNHGEGTKGECVKCLKEDNFRWRGLKEDDK